MDPPCFSKRLSQHLGNGTSQGKVLIHQLLESTVLKNPMVGWFRNPKAVSHRLDGAKNFVNNGISTTNLNWYRISAINSITI